MLHFPRALFPLPARQLERLTAVPMASGPGIGALTARFLVELAGGIDHYRPAEAARLATVALEVLAARLARELDSDGWPGRSQRPRTTGCCPISASTGPPGGEPRGRRRAVRDARSAPGATTRADGGAWLLVGSGPARLLLADGQPLPAERRQRRQTGRRPQHPGWRRPPDRLACRRDRSMPQRTRSRREARAGTMVGDRA